MGHGLDVQVFGVGGVARESAVTWSRALERSLCYAYGCWEVLEQKRPRPIDLIVGRSTGLGSALFAPVYARPRRWSSSWITTIMAAQNDLADEAGPETPAAYFHWRRSMAAIELLDLEQAALGWTPTDWQRGLFPAEYRDEMLVLHDGVDTRRFAPSSRHATGRGPRTIAGRSIPDSTGLISFVSRSIDRLRGFDRFLATADAVLRARPDALAVVVGDPIVRRGLDVAYHNKDYSAHLRANGRPRTPGASGSWARLRRRRWRRSWPPATCTSPPAVTIRSRDPRSRPWPPAASCWRATPSHTARSSRTADGSAARCRGLRCDGATGAWPSSTIRRRTDRWASPPPPWSGKIQPGRLPAPPRGAVQRAGTRRREAVVNVLFIHDAFPAQFGRLGQELATRHGWKCRFLVQSLSSCPTPTPEMLEPSSCTGCR